MMNRSLRLFFFLLLLSVAAAAPGADFSIRLPVSATVTSTDNTGKTWRQNGFLPVPYVAAVNQISACLRGQGWKRTQYISLGKDKSRCIMVWECGGKKITVMVWRILVDQSGFSWGINID